MTTQAKTSSNKDDIYYILGEERITSVQRLIRIYKKYKNEYEEKQTQSDGNPHNLGGFYFRGQDDFDHKLLPSIGHEHKYAGKVIQFTCEQERDLLHRFRRRSYFHDGRILNDWEVLFLARHHGLPTRILDWTSNPLRSLYEACCQELGKDGAVWAFKRRPEENYDINVFGCKVIEDGKFAESRRFLIEGVKVIYPFDISPRITAQAGIFTIQEDPWKPLEEYTDESKNYDPKYFDIRHIFKWRVPKGKKTEILKELHDYYGINYQTLYPDLDGLAKGTWQTMVMRLWDDLPKEKCQCTPKEKEQQSSPPPGKCSLEVEYKKDDCDRYITLKVRPLDTKATKAHYYRFERTYPVSTTKNPKDNWQLFDLGDKAEVKVKIDWDAEGWEFRAIPVVVPYNPGPPSETVTAAL